MNLSGKLIISYLSKFDLYLELCQCCTSFLVRIENSLNVLYRIVFLSNAMFNFIYLTIGSFSKETQNFVVVRYVIPVVWLSQRLCDTVIHVCFFVRNIRVKLFEASLFSAFRLISARVI